MALVDEEISFDFPEEIIPEPLSPEIQIENEISFNRCDCIYLIQPEKEQKYVEPSSAQGNVNSQEYTKEESINIHQEEKKNDSFSDEYQEEVEY